MSLTIAMSFIEEIEWAQCLYALIGGIVIGVILPFVGSINFGLQSKLAGKTDWRSKLIVWSVWVSSFAVTAVSVVLIGFKTILRDQVTMPEVVLFICSVVMTFVLLVRLKMVPLKIGKQNE